MLLKNNRCHGILSERTIQQSKKKKILNLKQKSCMKKHTTVKVHKHDQPTGLLSQKGVDLHILMRM